MDRIVSEALQITSPQATELDDSEIEDGFDFGDEEMCEEDTSDLDLDSARHKSFSAPDRSVNLRENIRRDLRIAKKARYKVGYLGETAGMIIISVACRIAVLGLSDEAMQAWGVRPSEYLVLLIRHPSAYQNLDELMSLAGSASTFLQLYVGLCDSYKPSLEAAIRAFQGTSKYRTDPQGAKNVPFDNPIQELFIGDSLNKLMNERFLEIARLRLMYHFSWTGAECFFHHAQGKILSERDAGLPQYKVVDSWRTPVPALLIPDHMVEAEFTSSEISLPLLAMQFTLRHFVKCTEFCLVCHCKTTDDFEALKPYVCSNGLCLFQYMALGMGPSLEYEIRSQPYVVDMLICLAHIRADARCLRDFPTGLGLLVPEPPELQSCSPTSAVYKRYLNQLRKGTLGVIGGTPFLLLSDQGKQFMVGDWILIPDAETANDGAYRAKWNCRVEEKGGTSDLIKLTLSLPICESRQLSASEILNSIPSPREVHLVAYNRNFDELGVAKKQSTVVDLLRILPSIDEMTQYLGHHSSGRLLSSWRERMNPAALDLLRWIVSSNRSCILQDSNNEEHLVTGMLPYIQFRLVQGAPDKEQRFIEAVRANVAQGKSNYPTIFAWHGSALENWHSILREGLHFETRAHGRAYGDGIYLSNQFGVSLGYTSPARSGAASWPQSMLNMKTMVSLNEVVNCTSQFISSRPHYVVNKLDWIQPRYLFVHTNNNQLCRSSSSTVFYKQDPDHLAYGPNGKEVRIPLSAISSSRRRELALSSLLQNRTSQNPGEDGVEDIDDSASVSTTTEDLTILLSEESSEDEDLFEKATTRKKNAQPNSSLTDFVPGSLQEQSLPLLAAPVYATPTATKLLHRHLQTALKLQEREELHELGWYIDASLIKTVYQWIVELHSFDPALPLAKDLKSAKMRSVVLEIRFPSRFPMEPPFVRVIRPRFLTFLQGGGGHVTAGGAMCMELLTNSGWSAVASLDSVLLQVRLAITSTDPRPARLDRGFHSQDYNIGEAVQAYRRACMQHDWKIPKEMDAMMW